MRHTPTICPLTVFTRVGFWRESVASNQASVAAAKGEGVYIPHGWDYMVYAYLQMANDAEAEGRVPPACG